MMLLIEQYVGSINKFDLVDGSIGKKWVAFRKEKEWILEPKEFPYRHGDERGTVICKCYHRVELFYFEEWLIDIYQKVHLIEYLICKFKDGNPELLKKVEENRQKLLE